MRQKRDSGLSLRLIQTKHRISLISMIYVLMNPALSLYGKILIDSKQAKSILKKRLGERLMVSENISHWCFTVIYPENLPEHLTNNQELR